MTTTTQRPAHFDAPPNPDRDRPYRCGCGARWSGIRTCHCGGAGCHRTFSGVSTFDAHRRGGHCLDPASIGLALDPRRAYDCWGSSEEAETA